MKTNHLVGSARRLDFVRNWLVNILVVSIVLIVVGACSFRRIGVDREFAAYQGDGRIELLVRSPGLSESYGYALILPAFSIDQAKKRVYRLDGLPIWEGALNVELATFTPIFKMPIGEADRLALNLPDDHRIVCWLLESQSGRMVGNFAGNVANLESTGTQQFRGSRFMKHLFAVDLNDGLDSKALELHVEYDIGQTHVDKGLLQLVVLLDARP